MDRVTDTEKLSAATSALKRVKNNSTIGLGTGTTTHYFIVGLSELVKNGLNVQCMASSIDTERKAKSRGINVIDSYPGMLDAYFDGADEVGPGGNLIKGGGGALTREKILAYNSREFNVMVDSSKVKEQLGEFGVPMEILSFGMQFTVSNIEKLGGKCRVRNGFKSDNGNPIIDCDFGKISNPANLEKDIKSIPGVVEVGLFNGLSTRIIQGKGTDCIVKEVGD
ncbi:MAG: ribose 5-phosphate isomerase A [Thermoplasmatales archaeon B_DKE]|nr:MAG: ribose 5-phosphate isomerase A [Thermoplasmatales archaeon B_DKE]